MTRSRLVPVLGATLALLSIALLARALSDSAAPIAQAQPAPSATPSATPSASPSESPAGGRVTLCHKPGTPAEQTLTLPKPAVQGHLGHGDTLGPCPTASPSPSPSPTASPTPTPTPTPSPTPSATPTATPTASPSASPAGGLVTLCHKPGTPAEQTLTLPKAAMQGHLGHGDTLGACPSGR